MKWVLDTVWKTKVLANKCSKVKIESLWTQYRPFGIIMILKEQPVLKSFQGVIFCWHYPAAILFHFDEFFRLWLQDMLFASIYMLISMWVISKFSATLFPVKICSGNWACRTFNLLHQVSYSKLSIRESWKTTPPKIVKREHAITVLSWEGYIVRYIYLGD